MPRPMRIRPGAVGIAFTVYDVWRRLPPKQRKQALQLARTHGPRIAAKAIAIRRTMRTPPR